jgi:hypothetical protein
MKNRQAFRLIGSILLWIVASALADEPFNYIPPNGVVPDETTATQIAEVILIPIYGRQKIKDEEPFSAKLHENVWTVTGFFQKGEGRLGGVALIEISKIDGRILRISHGQ